MLLGRAGAASDLFLDYACRDEWPPQPVERRGLRHALPLHWRAVWTTVAGGFTKNGRPHELRTTVASHCVGYGFLKFLTAPKAERLWHAVTPWTQSLPKVDDSSVGRSMAGGESRETFTQNSTRENVKT